MSELTSEISQMRGQINAATEEQSTFLAYDKRVKETASELTELQSKLADYNLLVDKMNTDTEVILIQQEAQELAGKVLVLFLNNKVCIKNYFRSKRKRF